MCERFVFGTESCLPIWPLQEAGARLFRRDTSWLLARHGGESTWETAACFRTVDKAVVPPGAVWKSLPGWVMLTRRHAQVGLMATAKWGGLY